MGKSYELDNMGYNPGPEELGSSSKGIVDFEIEGKRMSKKTNLVVTVCILVTEMCERLTYYSLVANLILYCQSKLDIEQTDATTINQVFSGFVYLIPIAGGYLADSYWGRFKTILMSIGLYLIGLVLVPVSALDFDSWGLDALTTDGRRGLFFTGLFFIALGTGGIKANVGPFGAEQVESFGKEAVQSFFNWFYWVINVGALVAYLGVAYIQQEISFAWGYFVPLGSMLIAVFIFVIAKAYYIRTDPKGSILPVAWAIVTSGACKREPEPNPNLPEGSEKKMLARAKRSFGGNFPDHQVDGVSSVIKVLPFCILVIMYWAIYAQMSNTFFAQGQRMDIRVGDTNIPAAALNVFNTVSIIIFIPLVDRVIYPCFEKMGRPITYLKRIGTGMVFAALAVFVAGIVEIYRKEDMNQPNGMHEQILGDKAFNASSMSVFVQVPQFALIGISEIFTSITTLEFAYNQAPVAMQGLLTGLFLASSGLGNWVSAAILEIVKEATLDDPWWSDEINHSKMENLMFLLGILMMANFIVFIIVAHFYSYQDPSSFEQSVDVNEYGQGQDTENGEVPTYKTFAEKPPAYSGNSSSRLDEYY